MSGRINPEATLLPIVTTKFREGTWVVCPQHPNVGFHKGAARYCMLHEGGELVELVPYVAPPKFSTALTQEDVTVPCPKLEELRAQQVC